MNSSHRIATPLNSMLGILLCCIVVVSYCHSLPLSTGGSTAHSAITEDVQQRQLFFDAKTKETNPPNFMRLVFMRLVYGLASTMGLEERLEESFNGAFVPPNADNDLIGLFGANGAENDDGGAADYSEIFDDY